MAFQYVLLRPGGEEELVAEGEQEVACMRCDGDSREPALLPQALREAVELYMRDQAETVSD
jgi:hypothetical protein